MTGTVTQLISLVSYGNDYLQTGKLSPTYFSNNSGFLYCHTVDFRIIREGYLLSKPKEMIVAADPLQWFKLLKKQGCLKLRLYFEYSKEHSKTKDHTLAGFVGGGGVWLIEAVYPRQSNYWANRWLTNHAEAADEKIWSVNYALVVRQQGFLKYNFSLIQIRDYFNEILVKIAYFAYDNQLDYWGDIFHIAIQSLASDDPIFKHNNDMLCTNNYSVIAKQMLTAASVAYVFGGAGSWNDMLFDTEQKTRLYDSLCEQLYDIINKSILAAINSY